MKGISKSGTSNRRAFLKSTSAVVIGNTIGLDLVLPKTPLRKVKVY